MNHRFIHPPPSSFRHQYLVFPRGQLNTKVAELTAGVFAFPPKPSPMFGRKEANRVWRIGRVATSVATLPPHTCSLQANTPSGFSRRNCNYPWGNYSTRETDPPTVGDIT
jgi:hypothetical protein